MTDAELSWFIDDTVSRTMQQAPGVSQISRVGGANREINVVIDPDKLTARGLTAASINNALRSFDLDAAGGRVQVGGREQTLRILGAVNTLEKLRDLTIPTGQGRYVKLTDVAQVGDGGLGIPWLCPLQQPARGRVPGHEDPGFQRRYSG